MNRRSSSPSRFLASMASAFTVVFAAPAYGAWPAPPGATTEQLADPANWPNDPEYASAFWLWGFVPNAASSQVPERERNAGAGMRVDAAWSTITGSPGVAIVLAGSGAQWGHPDLLTRWALSRGELPPPQKADGTTAQTADPHDLNGDGRFDVRDFTDAAIGQAPTVERILDPRLVARMDRGDVNGNGVLDPQDLIRHFSDGIDGDQNGRVDDICGWDLVGGDNDPEAASATASAMNRAAALAGAEANNGIGGLGVCPDCALMPVRVANTDDTAPTAAVGEALTFAANVVAPSQRATVVALLAHADAVTPELLALRESLRASGVVLLSRDRLSHVPLGAVGPDDGTPAPRTYLAPLAECGARLAEVQVAVSAPGCGAEAVGIAAGLAGLSASAAVMSASDVPDLATFWGARALPRTPGVPFEPLTGRGRVDASAVIARLAGGGVTEEVAPTLALPWNARLPLAATLSMSGAVPSGTSTLEVLVARGSAPPVENFRPASVEVGADAFVATVAFASVPPPVVRRDPFEESAVTLWLRATDTSGTTVSTFSRVLLTGSASLAHGYPVAVPGGITSSPRLVDLDGDLQDELVFTSGDGRVHALTSTGASLPGFPIAAPSGMQPIASLTAPPAASDLLGRGTRSLIVTTREGTLSRIDSDGTVSFTREVPGGMAIPPAVATTPSGKLIVALAENGVLHLFAPDGTPHGEPLQSPLVRAHTPIALADLSRDGWPDVVAVGETDDGRTVAVVMELTQQQPRVRPGWPVALAQTTEVRARAPVVGDFGAERHRGVVLVVGSEAPVVLDADGVPLVTLTWAEGALTPVSPALADVERNRQLQIVAPLAPGVGMWNAGEQVLRNERLTPSPAPLRTGFPTNVAPSDETGFVVGEVTGDGTVQVLHGKSDSVVAFGREGNDVPDWPQFVGAELVGPPALGVQRGRIVVAATTTDGWLYLWNAVGVASRIQWDGFGHDPEHTGFFGTPLPTRDIQGIGEEGAPLPAPVGCCSGAPSPVELSALGLLLLMLHLRRTVRPGASTVARRGSLR